MSANSNSYAIAGKSDSHLQIRAFPRIDVPSLGESDGTLVGFLSNL